MNDGGPKDQLPHPGIGISPTGDEIPHNLTRSEGPVVPSAKAAPTRSVTHHAHPEPVATSSSFELAGTPGVQSVEQILGAAPLAEEIIDPQALAELAAKFDQLSTEDRQRMQEEVKDIDKAEMAKIIAKQGMTTGEAQIVLQNYYNLTPGQARTVLAEEEVRQTFDAERIRPEQKEKKGTVDFDPSDEADAPQQADAIAQREEIKHAEREAREMMANPHAEGIEQRREAWVNNMHGLFGEKAGQVLGKLMKYTTIGMGVFAVLFLYLLSAHGKAKG